MKQRETVELKASPKIYYEVIDCHLLQTKAYICLEKGKLQNNMKRQNYNEGKRRKTKTESFKHKNKSRQFRYARRISLS